MNNIIYSTQADNQNNLHFNDNKDNNLLSDTMMSKSLFKKYRP